MHWLWLLTALATSVHAQTCRVLDPELQLNYAGPCVAGLAEGQGRATGIAEYSGGFHNGRKHGRGVKTWPNGDRYAGEWREDRRHGRGSYVFGRGAWQGERYDGEFAFDRRHGEGTYRWASGDVYSGPWRDDAAVGAPTPMMQARARFEEEARRAVAEPGRVVCRAVRIGIARREWQRGVVVEASGARVAVNIGEAMPIWTAASDWVPCFGRPE